MPSLRTRNIYALISYFAAVLMITHAPAQQESTEAPPPADKGKVESSGKFVPSSATEAASGKKDPKSAIKVLGGGKLEIGDVTLDQTTRTVTIPSTVNMVEGIVEYALVMEQGKVHESLLTTKATAEHIHIACLLLGMRETEWTPGQPLPNASCVKIEVTWKTNGPVKRVNLADFIKLTTDLPDQTVAMESLPWLYGGSQVDAAGFAAMREGSIIALISDEMALVTNPGPSRSDDGRHLVNTERLPGKNVPVDVILTLPENKKPSAAAKASEK